MSLIRKEIILSQTQINTVKWMVENEKKIQCGALALKVGLGKSLCALALTCTDIRSKSTNTDNNSSKPKDLYIVPPGLRTQWKEEMEKLTFLKGSILWSPQESDIINLIENDDDIVFVSYYLFLSLSDENPLITTKWNRIFADEAHFLRNPETLISKKLQLLTSKYRWAISGTFLVNTPIDLFGICKFLRCEGWQSKKHFEKELRSGRLIKSILIQSTKEDVESLQLKDKLTFIEHVVMTNEEMIAYNEIKRNRRKKINGKPKSMLQTINELRTAASDLSLIPTIGLPSTQTCSSQIKHLLQLVMKIRKENPNEKILIFSSMLNIIHNYKLWLEKLGQKVLYYTGEVSRKERDEIIDAFKNDDQNKFPILILGVMCANSGLNLQVATRVIILPFWTQSLLTQCEARAYRKGQTQTVYVYYLICKGTIDEKIYKMGLKKEKINQKTLSKGSSDLQASSSLTASEMKTLLDL